jgi:hypothetical protein
MFLLRINRDGERERGEGVFFFRNYRDYVREYA